MVNIEKTDLSQWTTIAQFARLVGYLAIVRQCRVEDHDLENVVELAIFFFNTKLDF